MNHEVKITQSGRSGTVFYFENARGFSFNWELAINGALIFVPSPPHWNYFCERNDFLLARNRRDEILERVCEESIRQKTSGAEYEIGDNYISISFR